MRLVMIPVLIPAIRAKEMAVPSWAWKPLASIRLVLRRPKPPWPPCCADFSRTLCRAPEGAGKIQILPSVRTPSTSKMMSLILRARAVADDLGIAEILAGRSLARPLSSNVSDLEQTPGFLANRIGWFPLAAPSSQAGARKPRGFDIRIGSRIKSQAKFQTAARREFSEDSNEESIPVDRCTGPAGRTGVCTDSRGERQYRPDQH